MAMAFLVGYGSAGLGAEQAEKIIPVAEWSEKGLRISVRQAALDNFAIIEKESAAAPRAGVPSVLLAVTLEFFNGNPERKFDFVSDFLFQLEDEFQNQYRPVTPVVPRDSVSLPPDVRPKSLYPESIYRRTVFFEAPVAKSKNFVLTIGAQNMGIPKPVVLNIARSQVRDLAPAIPRRIPQEDDLRVIGPPVGTAVHPGAVVHIAAQFPTDIDRPNGVYIVAPHSMFEDRGTVYRYDVRVPKDQPPGPFVVVVLARWGQADEIVLSKTITLEVVSPKGSDFETARSRSVD